MVRRWLLRHLTFYRLHAAYFLVLACVGAGLLWFCRRRERVGGSDGSPKLLDCVFAAVSALTVTGLLTVRVGDFSTLGMLVLLILMLLGSHVFTSLLPLYVRRFHFSRSPTHERQQVEKHCDTRQVQDKYLIAAYMSLEHKALITLCWLVPAYFVGVQLLGFLAISCYIAVGPPEVREVLQRESVNATFYGFFSTIAAFSNAGMTPLDENLISFPDPALLLPMSMLILSGNTMFAPSMRFIIWCLYRCTREKNPQKQVYEYLLMYPRKCFTHLFPQVHTVWLLITVVAFNAIDFVTFRSLDWNSAALKGMRTMDKLMAGLFQSINTRSAGMNVFILHELSAATLLLYAAMMSLYYESDLCIYRVKSWETDQVQDNKLSVQYRKLLSRDSAYLFLCILLICTLETRKISTDPLNYSVFNIVFEVISAYGNVGMSMGYSCALTKEENVTHSCEDVPYSLSGKWSANSKILLVAVMLVGRHRGLPDNIDSAIILPHNFITNILDTTCIFNHKKLNSNSIHNPPAAKDSQSFHNTCIEELSERVYSN
ncbi:unnamed protein product [Sphagnum jensenii]|uniref:Uncharacterized protein n=1 Tax=Sphagnum jensenii TaxID=128206 RepID=A0ABP0X4Q7_9BRYO